MYDMDENTFILKLIAKWALKTDPQEKNQKEEENDDESSVRSLNAWEESWKLRS